MRDSFRFIAHRGAPMRAPENTLASFRIARTLGATEIETDARLTSDGVVVLSHDDTLARYQLGNQGAEDLPYHSTPAGQPGLDSMDFGAWFSPAFSGEPIATLAQLLDTHASDFQFHIELKGQDPNLAAAVIALINARGLLKQCLLTSFSIEQLRQARSSSPDVRLGWLVNGIDETVLQTAAEHSLFQICPLASAVTPAAVSQALKIVSEVRAWGCPQEAEAARDTAKRLRVAGCIGITTDELSWFENVSPSHVR